MSTPEEDFGRNTVKNLSDAISGKTIVSAEIVDGMNDIFVVHFTGGTCPKLEYDWIYYYEVT